MRKKGRSKYFLVIFLCFSIFSYGFITININKSETERNESKFTIDLKAETFDFRINNYAITKSNDKSTRKRGKLLYTVSFKLKPIDFRVDTEEYVFYVNSKVIDNIKEKYIDVYNGILSR